MRVDSGNAQTGSKSNHHRYPNQQTISRSLSRESGGRAGKRKEAKEDDTPHSRER